MKPLWFAVITSLLCVGMLMPASCRQSQPRAGFRENFEQGAKRAYAAGNASLASGEWRLDGALLGNSGADFKTGMAALRLAPGGYAEMRFDLEAVPDTLSFRFGAFGGKGEAGVSVWYSNDAGRNWTKFPGDFRHSGPGFSTAELLPERGYRAPIRFRLNNESAGRINIDDFGSGRLGGVESFTAASGTGRRSEAVDALPEKPDANLLLGNPSGARADPGFATNYLLVHPQFTLSYNNERGTANWVSWHLSPAEQGAAPRCNCFSADGSLPETFFRAQSSNYIGSGFDRGHICPSDDRSVSGADNAATFLMSNIAPQAPDLNQKCWKELEEYARRLTESGKELYITAGCYGAGGIGSKGAAKTIANGRITVPSRFWKVILVLPDGKDDLQRINADTEVIAVDMPNIQGAGKYDWKSFRCTVSSIENATGHRFFSALPVHIARSLTLK